jgi:hypothetical protein
MADNKAEPRESFNYSLYWAWYNMMRRCYVKNNKFYHNYGGRKIFVSKSWREFKNFVSDMKKDWKQGLTLERIDNNRGYSKLNCRWASREEQANNRRTNRLVTFRGKTLSLAQWVKTLGLKSSTIRQRYYVYHWPVGRCLSTP